VTPGLATSDGPQTPEGVPEDVLEDSEEEPEMATELVPEVVLEEVPTEGAMITVCVTAPSPSHSAPASSSLVAPHSCWRGRCLWHGTGGGPRASHPICARRHSLGESMSTTHRALSQVQRVLCHDG
jgi:hypothetical protein